MNERTLHDGTPVELARDDAGRWVLKGRGQWGRAYATNDEHMGHAAASRWADAETTRIRKQAMEVAALADAADDFFGHDCARHFGRTYAQYRQGLVTRAGMEHVALDVLQTDLSTLSAFERDVDLFTYPYL